MANITSGLRRLQRKVYYIIFTLLLVVWTCSFILTIHRNESRCNFPEYVFCNKLRIRMDALRLLLLWAKTLEQTKWKTIYFGEVMI